MRIRHLVTLLMAVVIVAPVCVAFAADPGRVAPVLDRILSKKELVVGTAADMPPLNMTLKNGQIVGIEPDIARLVAASLNAKLTLKTIVFRDLLSALESGQVDMVMSSMTITPERNARVAFVGPYFASGKSILTNVDAMSRVRNTSQLNNPDTTLVALKSSTSQAFVENLIPKAKLVLTDGYDEAVAMIVDHKAQAMVADYPICVVSVARYPEKNLVTLERPLSYEPIGIALPPNDPLFWNVVQNIITSLDKGGQLKDLERDWFGNTSWLKELR